MFKRSILAAATVAMLATAAPAQAQDINFGTFLGGALGGLAGSQIGGGRGKMAAVGAGVLLGAILGGQLGRQAQPQYGQPQVIYRQPQPNYDMRGAHNQPGYYGRRQQVVIVQRPQYAQPQYAPQPVTQACPYSREYQVPVIVGGLTVPAYGTACSWDGGQSWQLGPVSTR